MAVAHSGTDTNNGHVTNATSTTFSHTNAGDFIAVFVGSGDATLSVRTVVSGTFNGDDLTHANVDADAGYERTEIWYRFAPDIATGNVFIDVGTGCDSLDAYAASFTGTHQTELDAAHGGTPEGEDDVTEPITTGTAGAYVASICQTVDDQTSGIGASQTQIGTLNGGWTRASYSGPHASPGAVTHTYVVPGTNDAVVSMISIKPPAAGTISPDMWFRETNRPYPSKIEVVKY